MAPTPEETRLSDEELYTSLLDYRDLNIAKGGEVSEDCILRDEMIECFVECRPTDKYEYIEGFNVNLRATTDPEDTEYLDEIFKIIRPNTTTSQITMAS